MNKVLVIFASLVCYSNIATADILDPAFSTLRKREFNQISQQWATCRITQCQNGFNPDVDGSRCIAVDSGEQNGGQILESVVDNQTNYKMFYTLGSINQGSADGSSNYRAASNLDIPTTIVSDSNSNYKIIIGVQK